ncbi:hypothetical protein D3C76_1598100 [compost metagenome]
MFDGQTEHVLHLVALHRGDEQGYTFSFALVTITGGFDLNPFAGHFLGDHADHSAIFR